MEPLPDMFGLTVEQTRESALHGRVVFLALPDDEATSRLRASLADIGVRLVGPSQLFTDGLDVPWVAFQLPSDIGLAPLLAASEFLLLLRRLADDLLAPAAGPDDRVAEWTPAHASRWPVSVMCSLFPDAVIVVDEALAAELPPPLRGQVRVFDGDVEPLVRDLGAGAAPERVPGPAPDPPSPMQDRLVVIVGCGRSGTTWLQQLWLAHERVAGLAHNETWLFHQLRLLWRTFGAGTGFATWTDRAGFVAALRRYCDGVLDRTRRRFGASGADYVVEKTPVHVERLDEIAAVYPDAWIVHLVRDGRDVARSMTEVPFFGVADTAAAAALWDRALTSVRRSEDAVRRFRDVRYESLVADPIGTMRDLWTWVGLEPLAADDPALVAAIGTPVSAHRRPADQDRHAADAAADVDAVYRVAGRTLVREGYVSWPALWRHRLTSRGRR